MKNISREEMNVIKALADLQDKFYKDKGYNEQLFISFPFDGYNVFNPFVGVGEDVGEVNPIKYYGSAFLNSDFVKHAKKYTEVNIPVYAYEMFDQLYPINEWDLMVTGGGFEYPVKRVEFEHNGTGFLIFLDLCEDYVVNLYSYKLSDKPSIEKLIKEHGPDWHPETYTGSGLREFLGIDWDKEDGYLKPIGFSDLPMGVLNDKEKSIIEWATEKCKTTPKDRYSILENAYSKLEEAAINS